MFAPSTQFKKAFRRDPGSHFLLISSGQSQNKYESLHLLDVTGNPWLFFSENIYFWRVIGLGRTHKKKKQKKQTDNFLVRQLS